MVHQNYEVLQALGTADTIALKISTITIAPILKVRIKYFMVQLR